MNNPMVSASTARMISRYSFPTVGSFPYFSFPSEEEPFGTQITRKYATRKVAM